MLRSYSAGRRTLEPPRSNPQITQIISRSRFSRPRTRRHPQVIDGQESHLLSITQTHSLSRTSYPNPTAEQKRKIEARIQTLVERHEAPLGARVVTEVPPLRQRLAARCPELSPDQARRLQEWIAQAVEKQRGRLVETRRPLLDEMRCGSRRARGDAQREFMSDNSFTDRYSTKRASRAWEEASSPIVRFRTDDGAC
jgi:hypothetical protein